MTNKVKGWLMLSPLIVIVCVWAWYIFGFISFLVIVFSYTFFKYFTKAIELILEDEK